MGYYNSTGSKNEFDNREKKTNRNALLAYQSFFKCPKPTNSFKRPYEFFFTAPPTSSSPASSHRTEKSGFTDENSEDMKIAKIKQQLVREFLAETLGTFILVLFGNGALAQMKGQGNFLS